MFDIGFSELMILAVVALVVIGPERLPKVARTVGHLMGRFQRYVSDVKSDIDRELRLDEMKKLREEVERQARGIETQVSSQMSAVQKDIEKPVADIAQLTADGECLDAAKPADSPVPEAAAPAPEQASLPPVAPKSS
ncbi:MAG TPA: Sec-independent protein translocase protein TatB [Rhodocyclaceae bacterium]